MLGGEKMWKEEVEKMWKEEVGQVEDMGVGQWSGPVKVSRTRGGAERGWPGKETASKGAIEAAFLLPTTQVDFMSLLSRLCSWGNPTPSPPIHPCSFSLTLEGFQFGG